MRSGIQWLLIAGVALVAVMLVSFALAAALGLADEAVFERSLVQLESEHGRLAVAAALLALLGGDLLLPLPSSVLMMVAGTLLGTAFGAAVNLMGALIAALAGFVLCRRYGLPAFRRICGEAEAARAAAALARISPYLVVATRATPVFAEVVSCLCGLSAMRLRRFAALVVLGAAPPALVYAYAGAAARREEVVMPLVVGIGLPLLSLAIGSALLRSRGRASGEGAAGSRR